MGNVAKSQVLKFLEERIANCTDPKAFGKPLLGHFNGLWRYRVGNIRIIADIQSDVLLVLIVEIAKRDKVYKK